MIQIGLRKPQRRLTRLGVAVAGRRGGALFVSMCGLSMCGLSACGPSGNGQNPDDPLTKPPAELFAPRLDVSVGTEPKLLKVYDLDGDKHKDLVVLRATGTGAVTVLSQKTLGSFQRGDATTRAGDTPYGLAIADVDNDGLVDLAVTSYLGAEAALVWGGDYLDRMALQIDGAHPIAIEVADLDADGKLDLVLANQVGNNFNLILNNGARVFLPRIKYSAGGTPGGLLVGDYDGDGAAKLDLVMSLSDLGVVRVFNGTGNGRYRTDAMPAKNDLTDVVVGQNPTGLASGKLNGDGFKDLVVCNQGDQTVSVVLGAGKAPGFEPTATPYPVGDQPTSVAIGDLNGDGKADVAVTNRAGASLSILYGNGDGTLRAIGQVQTGMQPESVVIDDLNGDGKADVAVANLQSGTVSIFFGI